MDERIKASRAQEARIAKKYGGTRNSGSGNGWQRKSDVRADGGVLFELKHTNAKSISIKAEDLEKNRKIAWTEGRTPWFGFHLAGRNYIILEEDDLDEILENQS